MRRLLVHLIVDNPPRKPDCFDSADAWENWLTTAHVSGERIVRRVDVGRTRADRRAGRSGDRRTYFQVLPAERIDFCQDCSTLRRERMIAEGRCCPPPVATLPELRAELETA